MRKFFLTLSFAVFAAAAFSQTFPWLEGANGLTLSPSSANLGIGSYSATSYSKIYLCQHDSVATGSLYGILLSADIDNANSTGSLSGITITSLKRNTNSSGSVYGISANASTYGKSSELYGGRFTTYNYNTANTGTVFGTRIQCVNHNTTNGTVYGLYSEVSGGSTNNRYSGYFTGGKFVVLDGNAGIGTASPQTPFQVGTGLGLSVAAANLDPAANYDLSFMKNTGRLLLAWNRAAGSGEQSFISNRGAGNRGGFGFYDYNNAGVMTPLMTLHGIGPYTSMVLLDVFGHIRAEEVRVCLNHGCDFVFDKDYKLMTLSDLSTFISENKHLPEIAPAAVMESEGINLSEMNAKLLQKVEELTLYLIQQNGQIENLQKQIDELKK